MNIKSPIFACIIIFVLSLAFYSFHLGKHGPEYRDDEIFYVQSTKQMTATGDWLSPKYFDENRFQKPILFYWFIGAAYKVFGVNWFAARFPSAVMAGLTLVVTWLMARLLFSTRVAFMSVAMLLTMPLFWRHAKNAVPDMSLNFFVVFSIYCLILLLKKPQKVKYQYLFFVSCALGFMIKGFVAVLAPLFTLFIYAFYTKNFSYVRSLKWLQGLGVFLIIVLPWFMYMVFTHGWGYLDYMVGTETTDRLINVQQEGNIILNQFKAFAGHFIFYIKTILTYMSPWAFFLVLVFPFLFSGKKTEDEQKSCVFLLGWMLSMVVFFSFIYFTIGHYMLVITTPLAILLSYGMIELYQRHVWMARVERGLLFLCMSLTFVILSLYAIFIVEVPTFWGYIFVGLYLLLCGYYFYKPSFLKSALILFCVLMVGKLQAPSFAQQGLTPHTIYKRFAERIVADKSQHYVVGVISHDLHEKELQVFFDQPVEKYGNDHEGYTHHMTNVLMQKEGTIYCLITYNDYNKYIKEKYPNLIVIKKEKMFRKKIAVDKELIAALGRMDQKKVKSLIMQDVWLLRKDGNGRS